MRSWEVVTVGTPEKVVKQLRSSTLQDPASVLVRCLTGQANSVWIRSRRAWACSFQGSPLDSNIYFMSVNKKFRRLSFSSISF